MYFLFFTYVWAMSCWLILKSALFWPEGSTPYAIMNILLCLNIWFLRFAFVSWLAHTPAAMLSRHPIIIWKSFVQRRKKLALRFYLIFSKFEVLFYVHIGTKPVQAYIWYKYVTWFDHHHKVVWSNDLLRGRERRPHYLTRQFSGFI